MPICLSHTKMTSILLVFGRLMKPITSSSILQGKIFPSHDKGKRATVQYIVVTLEGIAL
jgi:hypothetical protein